MKLLIADDDKQIREGIKHGIKWDEIGIINVYTASNGIEAYELFIKYCPEIIITDIRMPGMDGLELFKRIREKSMQSKVIILSAYSDFDYVKKALQYGALDYELKPVKVKNLINLVKNAKIDIIKERNSKIEIQKLKESYKAEFISGLLTNKLTDRNIILDGFLQYFNIEMRGFLMCIILEIDDYQNYSTAKSNDEKKEVSSFITSYARENFIDYLGGLVIENGEKQILIICKTGGSGINDDFIKDKFYSFFYDLKEQLSFKYNVSVSSGVSNCGSVTDFYNIYYESVRALKSKLYKGKGSINIFTEESKINNYDVINIIDEREIRQLITHIDINSLCSKISDEFSKVKENKCNEKNYIVRLSIDFLNLLLRTLKDNAVNISEFFEDSILNDIMNIPEYDTIDEYCDKVLSVYRYILTNLKGLNGIKNPLVIKALQYIHKNYNKDFNLNELAYYVGRTPNYVSHIFKKEVGMSYSDYRNNVRINKAKNLIRNTTLSISEIAEKVGFQDYSYFCQRFKKIEYIAPSNLRKG